MKTICILLIASIGLCSPLVLYSEAKDLQEDLSEVHIGGKTWRIVSVTDEKDYLSIEFCKKEEYLGADIEKFSKTWTELLLIQVSMKPFKKPLEKQVENYMKAALQQKNPVIEHKILESSKTLLVWEYKIANEYNLQYIQKLIDGLVTSIYISRELENIDDKTHEKWTPILANLQEELSNFG